MRKQQAKNVYSVNIPFSKMNSLQEPATPATPNKTGGSFKVENQASKDAYEARQHNAQKLRAANLDIKHK